MRNEKARKWFYVKNIKCVLIPLCFIATQIFFTKHQNFMRESLSGFTVNININQF